MAVKQFSFWQIADLRVEGVGMMHGGYTIVLSVKDVNTKDGKNIYISAIGKTNAAKVAGVGHVLFWCSIVNGIDNKKYILHRKENEKWAVGLDDFYIGDVVFLFLKINTLHHRYT
ncbi:hypothetical protein [Enterobacillus tribolii]|uniref:Uncharacterized protein n=1 Tax=Enterobacillus tribolii TaxID=1487935 RepID=A0A370R1F1_9GAMM|nr:hypothetical protein [Enterobacillus tribolii]MBW7982698.1 hypothetical protein [Enterobacillus tribolii]RDK95741.1 hypothetical protein C8D90_102222 [Enterobacillus tribolii]